MKSGVSYVGWIVGLATLVAGAAYGVSVPSQQAIPDRELERIRQATRAFHDIEVAVEAGYEPTDHCMESADGGMGYHYIHRGLLDDRLEVERPEILVYAPASDGARRLVGVEYVVPYSAWDSEDPPRVLGQDLRRSDDLRLWYLHVWVWEANPNGVFADWNPAVRCSP